MTATSSTGLPPDVTQRTPLATSRNLIRGPPASVTAGPTLSMEACDDSARALHADEIMPGPGRRRYKSGTSRTTRRYPMSTNVTPTFPQATGRRVIKALLSVLPAALHQQTQHGPTTPCPRRAGVDGN